MPDQTITCPQCNSTIPLSDALTQQIETKLRKQFTQTQKEQQKELDQQKQSLINREEKIKHTEQTMKVEIAKKLEEQKVSMWHKAQEEAKKKAKQEMKSELKMTSEALKEKEQALQEMRKQELDLRKEKQKIEDEKKELDLKVARTIDTERKKIQEEALKSLSEEYRFKEAEKDKQLHDLRKQLDEMRRKAEQGSQQTQGEILELELEEFLAQRFLHDTIKPVPKGITGADVIQVVHNNSGKECGSIIWEMKRTKTWQHAWIDKLKQDQRSVNADCAVIATTTLPKDAASLEHRDGVWICSIELVESIATALRTQLIQLNLAKQFATGKNEKMETLYQYVSSTEFKHRVEAIVEAFTNMQHDLQKERTVAERQWAKREKQIQQVLLNTSGLYGDLQGMLGSSIQSIPALEEGEEHHD